MKFKNRLFPVIISPAWIPELNLVERGPEGKGGSLAHTASPGGAGLGCWGWWVLGQPPLWLWLPPACPGAACTGERATFTAFSIMEGISGQGL